MAVGDALYDGAQPPPVLGLALNYERWGIGDIMQLPPGRLRQMNICLNYHHAIQGYRNAQKGAEWSKHNPDAWNLVSWYIAQRRERRISGNRNQ